jgi:hypothetical protein
MGGSSVKRQILYPILVIFFVSTVWFFFSKTNTMIADIKQADFALNATDIITIAVVGYVQEHGQWPTSWKNVESVPVKHGKYSWPDDMDDIKNIDDFVTIDFSLSLDQVAKQRGKSFTAIQSKDAAHPGSYHRVLQLLDAVEKTQAKIAAEKAATEEIADEQKPSEEKTTETPQEPVSSN